MEWLSKLLGLLLVIVRDQRGVTLALTGISDVDAAIPE